MAKRYNSLESIKNSEEGKLLVSMQGIDYVCTGCLYPGIHLALASCEVRAWFL